MIQKFTVSRDDSIYEAWPDVCLTSSGKLVCVFSQCPYHTDRSTTQIMLTESTDRGRTWTPKRPLTEKTEGYPIYNCARISELRDGRLVVVVDKLHAPEKSSDPEGCINLLYFSDDDGATWSEPVETAARGIVPDKLLELDSGRWLLAAHYRPPEGGGLTQRVWYSDDKGETWSDPVILAKREGLNLCEVSILPVRDKLVGFMRENSAQGWDCFKAISEDEGETWGEVIALPLPGCHRPVSGRLQDGRIMVTYRFMQGGAGGFGKKQQNFFSAVLNEDSVLAPTRHEAWARIMPIDYDRSPKSDTGYSGWVQFDDGEIYIVTYIVDDAPAAQIRGYSLRPEAFVLPE